MATLLNKRHEYFARSVAGGSTLVDAARAAGYPEKRAYSTASELRKRPDVGARIHEIEAKTVQLADQHQVYGMREALAECDEAFTMARKQGQTSAMVAATTLKSKLTGLLVERRQIDYKNVGELSDAELESLIASAEASKQGQQAIEKAQETETTDQETVPILD